MAKRNIRVKIPDNPTERIKLLGQVKAKHAEMAADSPLRSLKWDVIDPALADAKTYDDDAANLQKELEKKYGDRDKNIPTVIQALRDAREILLGTYSDNPKALGDYGYVVDDTPAAKKTASNTTP